jgi:hypothetical protein
MKHFSLIEWADFARDVVDGKRKAAMQAHLDKGCRECTEAQATWTRVREVARRERSYQPPESAIRMAKSLLPLHGHPGKASVARLLFDSFKVPAIAGVRATAMNARQMLYGIGSYRVDLRMEPQMDSDKVSLVGQVLNAADPVKAGAQVTVTLLRGGKVLAESQTNTLGEFQLECSLEGQLHLLLTLPRARAVKIPLLVPSASTMTGRLEPTDSVVIKAKQSRKNKSTRKIG